MIRGAMPSPCACTASCFTAYAATSGANPCTVVPNANRDNINPWFNEWKIESDPWVFVVDRGGNIRAKFDGPTTADEIEPALAQVASS